jgi:hypothetical protein
LRLPAGRLPQNNIVNMKSMRSADQLSALSSAPAIGETRVNGVISATSFSAGQNGTRASTAPIYETPNDVGEDLHQPSRPASVPPPQIATDGSNQDHAIKRHNSRDILKLERDRESVIHLAQFFRTQSPPPNNYVSLPDTGQPIQGRKSPFKMFRRQNSKRSSDPMMRTLQLPDSAVAAKTIEGHWHIAISIPVEHDHQEPNLQSQSNLAKHAKTKSSSAIQDGPITVLKPFMQDVRPAVLDQVHTRSQSWDYAPQTLAGPRSSAIHISPDAEAPSVSQKHYIRKPNQENTEPAKADQVHSCQPPCHDESKISSRASSSRQSDTRNSTETALTFASVQSSVGHKRGQSSISTAPSINHPTSPGATGSPNRYARSSGENFNNIDRPISVWCDSAVVNSADSDIFSANLKVADTAQGYGPSDIVGTQVIRVRKALQTPGPAPNRELPDIPRNGYGPQPPKRSPRGTSIIRSDREQPPYALSSESTAPYDLSLASRYAMDTESVPQGRQSRRERVKALRSRDMAKLKAMKKYEQVMASVEGKRRYGALVSPPSFGARVEPQYRSVQKRSLSYVSIAEEMLRPRASIALTPVMLVAEVRPSSDTPDPGTVASPLRSQRLYKNEKATSTRASYEARTPPRSMTPSPAAFDEEKVHTSRRRSSTNSASQSKGQNSHGQQQGYLKRHKSMPDESMEMRMRRIEASNEMIVSKLNAVLEKLLPAPTCQDDSGLDTIELLVQDLRSAVRMGQEELTKYGQV